MKNIISLTFLITILSCNSNDKNSKLWTDEEKDIVFKECINFYSNREGKSIEESNRICYCSLDILTENFKNKEEAESEINKNPSLRSLWERC